MIPLPFLHLLCAQNIWTKYLKCVDVVILVLEPKVVSNIVQCHLKSAVPLIIVGKLCLVAELRYCSSRSGIASD